MSGMNSILAMALESDGHTSHVRAGRQGATLTSYFHNRQCRQSHTDEEIGRKVEATFEARWKASEAVFEERWKAREAEIKAKMFEEFWR